MKISIGILAGGKSSRMGLDKKYLNDKGKSFIEGIIDEFKSYDELIISSNDIIYPYKTVKDSYKDIGALGGIYELLKASKNDYIFTLPVDMIRLDKNVVDASLMGLSSEIDCICYKDDDRIYPASALYSKRILNIVEEKIKNKDYKLSNLLAGINTRYLDLKYFNFKDKFINLNRPEDYKKYAKPLMVICGKKNSGKTTFIGRLVKNLSQRGLRVSVIKHDGHDFILDKEGTDTYIYKENGAYESLIYNDKYYKLDGKSLGIYDLLEKLDKVDLIIVEGLKDSDFEKYEIIREEKPVANKKNLQGYICPKDFSLEGENTQRFDIDRPDLFANYIVEKFLL